MTRVRYMCVKLNNNILEYTYIASRNLYLIIFVLCRSRTYELFTPTSNR